MVLVIFLTGVALPEILGDTKEAANRAKCANNLKQIGFTMILYSNENNGNFPSTPWSADSDKVTFYSKPDVANPFAKGADGVDPADVTAAMFLLPRTQDTTWGNVPFNTAFFICPSTDDEAPTGKDKIGKDKGYDVHKHSNFQGKKNLSYSMQVPYPSKAAAAARFRWQNILPPEYALMADMNPGTAELTKLTALSALKNLQKGNSLNHGGEGQNVLYGDQHVEFSQTPFCGVAQDNIYTYGPSGKQRGGDGIIGRPTGPDDNILLPTANEGKPATQPSK
jgi:hypothetical protein